jgi:GPI mannosyltransferase 1 subunit M
MTSLYTTSRFFQSTSRIIVLSVLLRLVLIAYGIYHDAHSPLKYTDVDYYVFTDAARFMYEGKSPYSRETYRYTPILAWMLIPTAWFGCFSWGKLMFALGDVAAGWIMILILKGRGMNQVRSLKYASIWLLNPMVHSIRQINTYFMCRSLLSRREVIVKDCLGL